MSLPPITIPDLDPAGPVDPANDLLLIRQGLNDKKITAGNLNNPILGVIAPLPDNIVASDVFLIGRNTGGGNYQNYTTPAFNVTFPSGTRCWFHQAIAPLGWTIDTGFGDRVMVTSGGASGTPYDVAGGTAAGTWQQGDVSGIPGNGLNVTQIPNHRHYSFPGQTQSNSKPNYYHGASDPNSSNDPKWMPKSGTDTVNIGPVGGIIAGKTIPGDGSWPFVTNFNTLSDGQCNPHNHGSAWRPAAAVGILAIKNNI